MENKDYSIKIDKPSGIINSTGSTNSKHLKPKDAQKKFGMLTKKYIGKFISKPIKNPKGKKWVKNNLILKGKK